MPEIPLHRRLTTRLQERHAAFEQWLENLGCLSRAVVFFIGGVLLSLTLDLTASLTGFSEDQVGMAFAVMVFLVLGITSLKTKLVQAAQKRGSSSARTED